ncbi:hypothetical protein H0E87_019990 [Populus deltoides]|uniref:Pentatricopeptide repeat-containing protein n=1 Tax=Populus deltoides TaxID=3696 RepID=A0A8T2XXK9_POPDE|nr:hypothetical protein H0E87_019990 [Populus deltoides]
MFDEAIDVLFQNSKVRGFVPRIWSCYCLTNLLIECRTVEMVVATYQHLQSIDSSPNDYTYTLAIEAFCVRGSSEEAVDVFWEMQEPGVTPNAFAHTTYIEGLCTHQGSDPGCKMLQGLTRVKIPIDVYVYAAVICGFFMNALCKLGEMDGAVALLIEMKGRRMIPDIVSYTTLIHGYCLEDNTIIEGLCIGGKVEDAEAFFDNLEEKCLGNYSAMDKWERPKPDVICHTVLIDKHFKVNNIQDATSLFKEYVDRVLKPDTMTCTALLSGYCKTNNIQVATSLFKQINDSGLEPDNVAYTALLSGYCSMGGIDMATTLVNGMKDKRIQPDGHAKSTTRHLITRKLKFQ